MKSVVGGKVSSPNALQSYIEMTSGSSTGFLDYLCLDSHLLLWILSM